MRHSRKALGVLACVASVTLAAAPHARAEVQLTIRDGRVSLVAKDATLRQILAEWVKVGQTKIVNGERVPGGPLTLQLIDMPEQQALEILLRSLSGYMAAPRTTAAAGLSRFDRIVVMPTVAPPVSRTAGTTPPAVFQPANRPTVIPVPPQPGQAAAPAFEPADEDSGDDDQGVVTRNPVFNVFPQPQGASPLGPAAVPPQTVFPAQAPLALPQALPPPNTPAPAVYPAVPNPPAGVAVPGMVAPVPQQQGRPGQPGQTPQ